MSASSSYVFPSSQSSSSDTYDFTPSETSESSTFDPSSFQSYPSDRSASASASGSFFRPPSASEDDDIDSLPSSDISDFGSDISDLSQSDAQKEWEQSLQQLELLLTMVIVPYLGKYFGRKFAYWSWGRYMEYLYPNLEVRYTNKGAFRAAGAVEAAL